MYKYTTVSRVQSNRIFMHGMSLEDLLDAQGEGLRTQQHIAETDGRCRVCSVECNMPPDSQPYDVRRSIVTAQCTLIGFSRCAQEPSSTQTYSLR